MTDGWEPPSEAECQACWDGLKAKLAAAEERVERLERAIGNCECCAEVDLEYARRRIAELEAEVKRLTDTFRRLHKMDMEAEGKVSDVASEIWTEMMQIIAENGDKPSGDATSILSQRAEDGKGETHCACCGHYRRDHDNGTGNCGLYGCNCKSFSSTPAPETPEGKYGTVYGLRPMDHKARKHDPISPADPLERA